MPPCPVRDKCEYCQKPFVTKSPKKRFCNDICRIYFGRKVNPKYAQKKKYPSLPSEKPILKEIEKRYASKEEARAACPPSITGIERAIWV